MKKYNSKPLSTLLCLLTIFSLSLADSGQNKTNPVKIKKVSLFKNGFGYFISESVLPKDSKSIEFGQLPVPTLGSFWIDYPQTLKVRSLFTSMRPCQDTIPIQSVADLLEANIGNQVIITTNLKDNASFSGIVESISSKNIEETNNPYIMGNSPATPRNTYSGVVLLKTDKGVVALEKSSIIGAEFENSKVTTKLIKNEKKPSLRMELEERSNGETVTMSYLTGGITWSPSYRVDLSDTKLALFSANAVIINEVADLENVDISLVTGFPNIKYANMFSPVSMEENLSEYLNSLSGGGRSSRRQTGRSFEFSNQAVVGYLDNPTPVYIQDEPDHSGSSDPKMGTVSEDLFLYPVKNINIKQNETACIPIFSTKVPCEHIYIWNIGDNLTKDEYYNRSRNKESERDTIWHVARLTNTSSVPWTTAPCEFVNNGQITGQDICYYTPAGSEATIHINHAINISTEQSEYEIKRDRSVKNFHGRNYDLVTIEGRLNINSRLDKTIKIEINKQMSGNLLKTEPEAIDHKVAAGLKEINTNHKIVWTLQLKPGEDKKLIYNYDVYVSN